MRYIPQAVAEAYQRHLQQEEVFQALFRAWDGMKK